MQALSKELLHRANLNRKGRWHRSNLSCREPFHRVKLDPEGAGAFRPLNNNAKQGGFSPGYV
jgi:hypothetical protein